MVVLALAFWLGREVTIPIGIVSQIGLAHAATLAVIVTRIGFTHANRGTLWTPSGATFWIEILFGHHRGTFWVPSGYFLSTIGVLFGYHPGTFWAPSGYILGTVGVLFGHCRVLFGHHRGTFWAPSGYFLDIIGVSPKPIRVTITMRVAA